MKRLTFEEWLDELEKVADDAGYILPPGGLLPWEIALWREMYDKGLTPRKAWNQA